MQLGDDFRTELFRWFQTAKSPGKAEEYEEHLGALSALNQALWLERLVQFCHNIEPGFHGETAHFSRNF